MIKDNVKELGLRLALSFSYLSAVADRFGIWGEPGSSGVVWGNFENFLNYTAHLNGWAPAGLVPTLGYVATGLEIILAILLIFSIRLKETAYCSFFLLSSFALAMSLTDGIKGAFDYGVFTACFASLLLTVDFQAKKKEH